MKRILVLLSISLATSVAAIAAERDLGKLPPPSSRADITFEKDILPLFKESCVRCHGPERPKAGLRLDSAEAVLKGGKNGKVVKVGDSSKSDLVVSIAHIDPEFSMPPKRQRPPQGASDWKPARALTPEEVGLVRAWIDQGAR